MTRRDATIWKLLAEQTAATHMRQSAESSCRYAAERPGTLRQQIIRTTICKPPRSRCEHAEMSAAGVPRFEKHHAGVIFGTGLGIRAIKSPEPGRRTNWRKTMRTVRPTSSVHERPGSSGCANPGSCVGLVPEQVRKSSVKLHEPEVCGFRRLFCPGLTHIACRAAIPLNCMVEWWLSGRKRSPAKGVDGAEPSRGFESLPLRHPVLEITSYCQAVSRYGHVAVPAVPSSAVSGLTVRRSVGPTVREIDSPICSRRDSAAPSTSANFSTTTWLEFLCRADTPPISTEFGGAEVGPKVLGTWTVW